MGGTEFWLLGSVEVRTAGGPVDIGPARQRGVLAALLADARRPVPVDLLVSRVWGASAPGRARHDLYSYLSRLRRALSEAGGHLVVRRGGGYLADVEPQRVDLHRYRYLVGCARTATDAVAWRLHGEARALWRGPAVADVESPWLADLREELALERRGAELDRHDVGLRLGHHTELLPDLVSMADADPLDERLAGQLLLALARCGRQAEALERFETLRRRLAEELGTDPGSALFAVHREILTGAAAGPGEALPLSAPPMPVRPQLLPASSPAFTGRTEDLDAVTAALADPASVCVISGTAGVGKTWLAVRWASAQADRFPDGQLYLDLRGFDAVSAPVAPTLALRTVLEALGAASAAIPDDLAAQAGLYRTLTAERALLVVLDNARNGEQVAALLPASPSSRTLVTSRDPCHALVAQAGARPLPLDLLGPADARALLARRIGATRLTAEPAAADAIVAGCAGLPLALALVAARAATHPDFPLADLATELAAPTVASDLRAVFAGSYRTLSEPAARLFRRIGTYPGADIDDGAAAALAGADVADLLAELVCSALVSEVRPGRYAMHDLLRAYARELTGAAVDHPALGRVLAYHLARCRAAALTLEPHRDPLRPEPQPVGTPASTEEALFWFERDYSTLLLLVAHASDAGHRSYAWRLAVTLTTFCCRRGRWRELAVIQRHALAAAEALGDLRGSAQAAHDLALAETMLGRHALAEALLWTADERFADLDDSLGRGYTQLSLGWLRECQDRYADGLSHDERALALFRTAGDAAAQARALNALGWDHVRLGDPDRALARCREALRLHRDLTDPGGAARAWDTLGWAHHHLGRDAQAVACYGRALERHRAAGDVYGQAETLTHLGDAHHRRGDRTAARDAWRQALAILTREGLPDGSDLRTRLAGSEALSPQTWDG